MNVAIIHYHLNRGGVTQVIANHLRSLCATASEHEACRVALIYGGRREGWPEGLLEELAPLSPSLHEVGGLEYDDGKPARPDELADQMRGVLQRINFDPEETILHVHNHGLGKNVSLPGALARLAKEGYRLLLHIHDFAEDFRPDNYRRLLSSAGVNDSRELAALLYPQAPNIHYAVLNRRDYRILQEAGVQESRLHLCPNPVAELGLLAPREESRQKLASTFGVDADWRFVLYPVRCIRRKNLGEVLLHAALADGKTRFGFTLAPMNPIERPSYNRWKSLAAELALPCVFEVGGPSGLAFQENLSAADQIITTSVAEGFGMVFLETWLAGRPLVGRDLPEITSDFVDDGIRLDWVRPALSIPVSWIGSDTLLEATETAYREALNRYDRKLPPEDQFAQQLDGLTAEGLVDFGLLGARLQEQIIRTVRSRPPNRDRLCELNPWIADALSLDEAASAPVIESNAKAVRDCYSFEVSGRRLYGIYKSVGAEDCSNCLESLTHGECILDSFLDLSRFHPIRVES